MMKILWSGVNRTRSVECDASTSCLRLCQAIDIKNNTYLVKPKTKVIIVGYKNLKNIRGAFT